MTRFGIPTDRWPHPRDVAPVDRRTVERRPGTRWWFVASVIGTPTL
jgi:hypothetical protein